MENTNVTEQSTNEIMPMAASGETNFASLTEKTTPASGDMFLMEDSEDTKKINYDKLADAILNKLTSKTYSGLETTAKNFVTAINELNSKSKRLVADVKVLGFNNKRYITISNINSGYGSIFLQTNQGILDAITVNSSSTGSGVSFKHMGEKSATAEYNKEANTITIDMASTSYNHGFCIIGGGVSNTTIKFS